MVASATSADWRQDNVVPLPAPELLPHGLRPSPHLHDLHAPDTHLARRQLALDPKIVEHAQVTVRRVSFIGNEHVSETELREVMQTGQGSIFSFGSGGPYRQDMFERDVLMLNALYYDKGYMSAQIGTPRVMLTPDREGIEITVVIHEGPRYKIRQLKIYERDDEGHEVEPIGGRRALRQMIHAHSGDYFKRAAARFARATSVAPAIAR